MIQRAASSVPVRRQPCPSQVVPRLRLARRVPGSAPGFSLVEAVLVLGLLGGSLLGAMAVLPVAARRVEEGRRHQLALLAARQLSARLELVPRDRLVTWGGPECDPGSSVACRSQAREHAELAAWQVELDGFLRDAEITIAVLSLDTRPLSRARGVRVQVAIAWSEGARTRRLDLTSVRR